MTEETNHGKLVALKQGIYTVYVFQLDDSSYIMCTKLPNWGDYNLNIGDSGYITTQSYMAGETYFDRKTESPQFIMYTNVYFKEFIKDINSKDIIL